MICNIDAITSFMIFCPLIEYIHVWRSITIRYPEMQNKKNVSFTYEGKIRRENNMIEYRVHSYFIVVNLFHTHFRTTCLLSLTLSLTKLYNPIIMRVNINESDRRRRKNINVG